MTAPAYTLTRGPNGEALVRGPQGVFPLTNQDAEGNEITVSYDAAQSYWPQWLAAQARRDESLAQTAAQTAQRDRDVAARNAANTAAGTPTPAPAGNGATASAPDEYAAFKTAFRQALGRDITEDEQNSNAFVQQLDNWLFKQLPYDRQMSFSLDRILQLPNEDLLPLLRSSGTNPRTGQAWQGWTLLAGMPAERFASFDNDYILKEALPFLDTANPTLAAQIRQSRGIAAPAGSPPGSQPPGTSPGGAGSSTPTGGTPPATGAPAGAGTPPPAPGTAGAPAVEIPSTHAWIQQVGAQQWYYAKVAAGMKPEEITVALLRKDMQAAWDARKADPSFDKRIYAAAEQYYARTGFWPTEVELNQFTQNLPDVPNLSPNDGKTAIPKGENKGDKEKWKVPTDPATGKPQPLPPGYEWRFSSDGTPVPWDNDQTSKDLFSGWYQNPATGEWTYNPLLGAADYLGGGDQNWSNLLGGFISRTGRMPTKDEARALAARLWAGADTVARTRAEQFAAANGFWPTPFELEYGAAKDTDANTGGGGQGAAGVGQVPVFVPGVGVVLTQGQALGTGGAGPAGGFVFDPFQGIPGQVRPWVKEVLNGTISADQAPPQIRDWVNYALAAFRQQLPTRTPDQLPDWGQREPVAGGGTPVGSGGAGGATGSLPPNVGGALTGAPGAAAGAAGSVAGGGMGTPPTSQLDDILGTASFLNAWRQFYPDQPAPTADQLKDVGWLSQADPALTQYLPSGILKQFPLDKLALLSNDVLLQKVDLGTIAGLPNERLLGVGQYQGSGFDLGVIAALPNERLLGVGRYAGAGFPPDFLAQLPNERLLGTGQYAGSGLSRDDLAKLPLDAKRRAEIDQGLAAPAPAPAPVTATPTYPGHAGAPLVTAAEVPQTNVPTVRQIPAPETQVQTVTTPAYTTETKPAPTTTPKLTEGAETTGTDTTLTASKTGLGLPVPGGTTPSIAPIQTYSAPPPETGGEGRMLQSPTPDLGLPKPVTEERKLPVPA